MMSGTEVDAVTASYAEGVRDGRRKVLELVRPLFRYLTKRMEVTSEAIEEMQRILTSVE